MQQIRKLQVCAIAQQSPEEKTQHVPTHWRTYFAVTSADDAAKRVTRAGGKLLMEPFDVFQAGRMAMATDPTGAMFGLWQAKQHVGFQVTGEPGAVAWNELLTTDPAKAAAFYGNVLGVKAEKAAMPGMDYTMLKAGGKDVAGMMKIMPQMGPIPSNWMVYFQTADVEASVKKAQSLGGKLMLPAQEVGAGRFAGLLDPQGGAFAVFKPAR
jgi:predicted enzyme related to lactoylglutathione lyase